MMHLYSVITTNSNLFLDKIESHCLKELFIRSNLCLYRQKFNPLKSKMIIAKALRFEMTILAILNPNNTYCTIFLTNGYDPCRVVY